MNNALQIRQQMFALALPLTAALYIARVSIQRALTRSSQQRGSAQSVADRKAPYVALYLGFAHRAGALGLDHL
jgi:hypothetical protein